MPTAHTCRECGARSQSGATRHDEGCKTGKRRMSRPGLAHPIESPKDGRGRGGVVA